MAAWAFFGGVASTLDSRSDVTVGLWDGIAQDDFSYSGVVNLDGIEVKQGKCKGCCCEERTQVTCRNFIKMKQMWSMRK